jgi:hypothetical protein
MPGVICACMAIVPRQIIDKIKMHFFIYINVGDAVIVQTTYQFRGITYSQFNLNLLGSFDFISEENTIYDDL